MSEKEKYLKKAIRLSIIVLSSYVIANLLLLSYSVASRVMSNMETSPTTMRHIFITTHMGFEIIFLPLIRLIHFYGSKAKSKPILIITNIITTFLLIILVFILIIWARGI